MGRHGDLSGVLQAQPLPENMSQVFLGRLDRRALAAVLAQCTILISPPLHSGRVPLLAEALAAGLIVLGSRRNALLVRLKREGLGSWTVDLMQPDTMLNSLGQVLDSPDSELNRLRENGRAYIRRCASQSFADRLRETIATLLSNGTPELAHG